MTIDLTKSTWRLKPGEQRALLVFGDLLMASLALLIGIYVWWAGDAWLQVFDLEFFRLRVQWWFYLLPIGWLLLLIETYDLHRAANWNRTVRAILLAGLVALLIYLSIYFLAEIPGKVNRRAVGVFIVATTMFTLAWRWYYIKLIISHGEQRRALVIGAGSNGRTLAEIYKTIQPTPFNLIAYIDDDPSKFGTDIEGYTVIGNSETVSKLVEELLITDLIVSITGEMKGETFRTILELQEKGVEITRMPTLYEELLGRVPIHHLEYDWILKAFVDDVSGGVIFELFKRIIDILAAMIGFIGFLAILPIIALAIVLDSGFPIFYKQERLGRGARSFDIIKFRTMRTDAEKEGSPQMAGENDPRITKVGNFLRITRIDEIPQFINVLRGEMSMVGPRAERAQWVETFEQQIPFYRARLLVKPGISGWAQINYGYAATVEDTSVKLEYDLYYIKHRSVFMDIVILLRTVGTVLGRKGR